MMMFQNVMVCFKSDRLLEQSKKQYIVAARLKSQPESIKKQSLDEASHQHGDKMLFKEIAFPGERRLLVNYTEKRAKKDAHDRQKALVKMQKKINKSKILNRFSVTIPIGNI